MPEVIVVGIGNPYRGDDAAGWAVIDALEKRKASLHLCKQRGDVAELMDVFASHSHVYLVDACTGLDHSASWRRIEVHQELLTIANTQTSTHALSVAQAVALAKNLDILPQKLIVYAIVGHHFHMSSQLSPSVSKAIDEVAEALLKEEEIKACMKKA